MAGAARTAMTKVFVHGLKVELQRRIPVLLDLSILGLPEEAVTFSRPSLQGYPQDEDQSERGYRS